MIILTESEKKLKNSISFNDRNFQQIRYWRNAPQYNKSHVSQDHSQGHTHWFKAEHLSSKIRNNARVSIIQYITRCYNYRSPTKIIQILKEKTKLALCI
jgi:hypothetical protein